MVDDNIKESSKTSEIGDDWKSKHQDHEHPQYKKKESLSSLNEKAQSEVIHSFISSNQCLNGVNKKMCLINIKCFFHFSSSNKRVLVGGIMKYALANMLFNIMKYQSIFKMFLN